MPAKLAKLIAVIGLLIELALPLGQLRTLFALSQTFASLPGESSAAASSVTQGAADALVFTLIGGRVALVGLVLFGIATWRARLRQRWIFWLGLVSFVPWLFLIGVGTLLGIVGITLFIVHRDKFLKKGPNKALQPTPMAVTDRAAARSAPATGVADL